MDFEKVRTYTCYILYYILYIIYYIIMYYITLYLILYYINRFVYVYIILPCLYLTSNKLNLISNLPYLSLFSLPTPPGPDNRHPRLPDPHAHRRLLRRKPTPLHFVGQVRMCVSCIGVVSVVSQYMVYMVYNCVYYCDT
jgi:hypothetical protein